MLSIIMNQRSFLAVTLYRTMEVYYKHTVAINCDGSKHELPHENITGVNYKAKDLTSYTRRVKFSLMSPNSKTKKMGPRKE